MFFFLFFSFVCLPRLPLTVFYVFFFFFNDTATTEIYTLSLHDALPIIFIALVICCVDLTARIRRRRSMSEDRKSTRLNSSHRCISYAVFCLKKKKKQCVQSSYKQKKENHSQ